MTNKLKIELSDVLPSPLELSNFHILQKNQQSLLAPLKPLGTTLWRYRVLLIIIIFSALYIYILLLSGAQAERQPSAKAVDEQVKATVRPRVDEATAETMMNLEDQNLDIKAIFNEARENPFVE